MRILKKILSIFLRVGISIALMFFLFRQVDKKSLLEIVKNADKPLLLLVFFAFFLNYILSIVRWELLLKAANICLPLKRVVISYAGGLFFNLFLPSTIGGDFMRSIDLAAHTKKAREVIVTVFLDRLSGYIGLVLLTLFSMLFGWRLVQDRSVLLAVLIIVSVLCLVLLALFNKFFYSKINKLFDSGGSNRIGEFIGKLHREIHIFRNQKKMIIKSIFLSLLIQIFSPIIFYIIARALGANTGIIYFFVFIPIISAITLLPISIGGLGLRDATTIFFFAKAGLTKDLSLAMSLLSFFFIVVYSSIGGLIYVLTVRHRRLQRH